MSELVLRLNRSWMLVGWITIFLVGTDLFVVSPFLPAIGNDLHKLPSSLTMAVSIFSIVYAIACPIQAKIAEKIGVHKVLLFGVLTISLANLFTSVASDLTQLLLSRGLAGLAAASISPMLYVLTSERTVPQERAGKLALINSGLVVALVFGAPLGLLLGAYSGWRWVFSLLALAFVLMVPVNSVTWLNGAAPTKKVAGASQERLSEAIIYFVSMICWASCVYAIYTLLSTALNSEHQMNVQAVAMMLTSYGVGAAIGGVLGGRLADRIGAINMVRLSFLLMALALLLLLVVYPTKMVWALSLNLFLLALVAYGFFPALQACTAMHFVTRRPTVMGLVSSSLYIGITLGSFVGGKIFTLHGMTGVILFSTLMALAGMVISLFLRKKSVEPR